MEQLIGDSALMTTGSRELTAALADIQALEQVIASITVEQELQCEGLSATDCRANKFCTYQSGWLGTSFRSRCTGKRLQSLSLERAQSMVKRLQALDARLEYLDGKGALTREETREVLALRHLKAQIDHHRVEAEKWGAGLKALESEIKLAEDQANECKQSLAASTVGKWLSGTQECTVARLNQLRDKQAALFAQRTKMVESWTTILKRWSPFIIGVLLAGGLIATVALSGGHLLTAATGLVKEFNVIPRTIELLGGTLGHTAVAAGTTGLCMAAAVAGTGGLAVPLCLLLGAGGGAASWIGAGALGALGTGLNAIGTGLGAVFCDARLKTILERLPGQKHRIHLYRFRWNHIAEQMGLRGETIGVLAQEVASVFPPAVRRDPVSGYLLVDHVILRGFLQHPSSKRSPRSSLKRSS